MHEIRRAGLAGQVGGRRARDQDGLVALLHDIAHGERDRRVRHVDDGFDVVTLDPFARDIGAEIGLVHVIAAEHLDRPLHLVRRGQKILHRHLGGGERARAGDIGIKARHVRQHAKPQRRGVVGLRRRKPARQTQAPDPPAMPANSRRRLGGYDLSILEASLLSGSSSSTRCLVDCPRLAREPCCLRNQALDQPPVLHLETAAIDVRHHELRAQDFRLQIRDRIVVAGVQRHGRAARLGAEYFSGVRR